ncbi:hypothetical protein [Kutzneria sp. 744]|uniref:hypothetical protein n=1 Tax=Kutzneria sp. (strain 744) TaxID=345341 RepID=UPI0005BE0C63|nr:hypothetical protein [Kutzneria sp. 744]
MKFVRTATASAAAVVLAVLFAVQAQAASPSPRVTAQPDQGNGDLIFAGAAGLFILAAAFGVIIYAARHRHSEQ